MNFKALLREKEILIPVDDCKINRDHKRIFIVSRILGHDLEIPGGNEW